MLGLAQRLGVNWSMMYAGRSLNSLPFIEEVARFGERIEIRTDDVSRRAVGGGTARRLPRRHNGVRLRARADADRDPRELAGRDNVELHFERFAAPPVIDGREFSVAIASTGEEVVSARTRLCWRRCGAPASRRRTHASRASAAHAGRKWWPATSTTATRC